MKKPVYKLLDEKGRVLIPLEMRQKAEIEKGLCPCSRKDHEP